MPQLVAELILHWRNLLRVAIGGAEALVELAPEQRARLAGQARCFNQSAIMRAITLLCEAENELRWNTQQRLLLELYSLRIMSEEAPPLAAALAAPARPATRAEMPPTHVPAARREAPMPPPTPAVAAPAPISAAALPTPPSVVREPLPSRDAGVAPPEAPDVEHPWTLPRVKTSWPQFIEWMRRSAKLDNLRERIVEKCQPAGLIGATLTLATPVEFVRDQVKERPQVKSTLEQCLQSYFKVALNVIVEVQSGPVAEPIIPAAAPAPAPASPVAPQAAPPLAEPTPPEAPARDVVHERMQQVFAGSQEIMDS